MAYHDHILNRLFQRPNQQFESCKQNPELRQIKSALIVIKGAVTDLPTQQAGDISSALKDIENALESETCESTSN